jgi:hypothetical protein
MEVCFSLLQSFLFRAPFVIILTHWSLSCFIPDVIEGVILVRSFFVHVASSLKYFPFPLYATDSRVLYIILGTSVDLVFEKIPSA